MAYVGHPPFQEFTNPPTKDSFTGDGSTVAFDMSAAVASNAENALEVYVNNVRQEPGTGKAFTLGVDGSNAIKRITFTAAPANGAAIYVINDKTNTSVTAPLSNDLNGTELILDGDGDTSITADTDDRIDFKLAGVEHISIGNSSGDTIIKTRVDAKDIMFQQFDGRDVLEINDAGFVALHNGDSGSGQLRIYEDDDNGANFTAFQVGTQSADITYTLPTADGSSGQAITTNGSGVLSFATVAANTPTSADGQALGSASLEWSDLFLADSSTIQFGADQDTILTHTDGSGLTLNSTNKLMFNDASQFIHAPSATVLDIGATDEIELTATLIDVVGNFTNSGTIVSAGIVTAAGFTIGSAVIGEAELEILDGATVTTTELNLIDGDTSRGTTAVASGDGILINDAGTMRMTNVDTVSTYFASHTVGGGNIVTTGALGSGSIAAGFGAIDNGTSGIRTNTFTAETAFVPDASGGADLGTTSLEFNDAFFNDGAVINFGDDQDVKLTHTADTGLTLNSTMKLMFNDASQFIQGTSATVLSIAATDEIDLTATAVDLNGTLNVSGVATFQATPVFPDGSLAVADLDIDGATDIGAAIVDADLFIVDDGAGGTNRKTTAARIKTYAGTSGAVTAITSVLNTSLVLGRDADNDIDFTADNIITFRAAAVDQVKLIDNVFSPVADSDVDLGTSSLYFKDAFIDTITTTGTITTAGELDAATLDISGAIDIAGASQFSSTITVGVDDTGYDVKFFGATADAFMLWDESVDDLILGGAARLGVGTTGSGAAQSGSVTISKPGGGEVMPTAVTAANSYIHIGNNEYGDTNTPDGKAMIAFGYTGGVARANAPAYIGYEEVLNSGYTKGNLTFYTRDVTTDTAPALTMKIDNIGAVTKPLQPAFSVTTSATQEDMQEDADVTIVFGLEIFDTNGDFASNTFTAPVTGKYMLTAKIVTAAIDHDGTYYAAFSIITSNRNYTETYSVRDFFEAQPEFWPFQVSAVVDMDASDTAFVRYRESGPGASQTDVYNANASGARIYHQFTGYLLG